MESANLDRFFTTIDAELNAYNKFKRQVAPTFAPDFNLFSCLRPDELRLSSVIAMLLDPNGDHGQGETFLKHFLEIIESLILRKDIIELIRDGIKNGQAKVITEAPTEYNRRIDILVDLGNVGLAIENKPGFNDLDKQLEDYIKKLDKNYSENFLLIYLSGYGQYPAEHSLNATMLKNLLESGQFLVIGYLFLREWIHQCTEKCRSSRVRGFLEDFESYITLKFDGGLRDMDKDIVIKQAAKKENITAAFSVGTSWPDIARELVKILAEQIGRRIESIPGPWEVSPDFDYCSKYTGVSFRKKGWSKYQIRFEFDMSRARELFCGVRKTSEREPDDNDKNLAKDLDDINKEDGFQNTWWAWRQFFDTPYRDWSASPEPWAGIYENGKTVDVVASMLERVIKCVADDIDRIEGIRKPDAPDGPV